MSFGPLCRLWPRTFHFRVAAARASLPMVLPRPRASHRQAAKAPLKTSRQMACFTSGGRTVYPIDSSTLQSWRAVRSAWRPFHPGRRPGRLAQRRLEPAVARDGLAAGLLAGVLMVARTDRRPRAQGIVAGKAARVRADLRHQVLGPGPTTARHLHDLLHRGGKRDAHGLDPLGQSKESRLLCVLVPEGTVTISGS